MPGGQIEFHCLSQSSRLYTDGNPLLQTGGNPHSAQVPELSLKKAPSGHRHSHSSAHSAPGGGVEPQGTHGESWKGPHAPRSLPGGHFCVLHSTHRLSWLGEHSEKDPAGQATP
eukprot:CAMPEP_0114129708 /NCGR_PEP_ID=MMETSP0043_2-20121206/11618_1 /TAXON_ID=464988 /ORGANISM="Hemiselmis andersenii, Strain CCMP644" /LENGTH=113 /DNA_ID=CAMNT_0001222999 /DNA_START=182 /DNA_END=519 /DNA_ORIENTATION=+